MFEFSALSPKVKMDFKAMEQMVKDSPQLDDAMKSAAEDMKEVAVATFHSQSRGQGDGDYLSGIEVRKFPGGWVLSTTDPKSHWVEAGAHAGGKTPVLGYRPMRAALDAAEEGA